MFRKSFIVITLLLTSRLLSAAPLIATQYGDFDHYVLALSWQTGFCHHISEGYRRQPQECLLQQELADKRDFLTVHGLWPGLPDSIAAYGVDNARWRRFGCATRPLPNMPEVKTSRKCQAAETGLSAEIAKLLNQAMPGANPDSCLERYEYAKHGICFGFNPDAYFATMVRLTHEIKGSALGTFLARHYGQYVSREAFNAAVAEDYGWQSVRAFKLACHGNPAWLTGIQVFIKAPEINAPLTARSFLPQPHPGNCPEQFVIDQVNN